MAGTTSLLFVKSFPVLDRSGIKRVGTVWLIGDFFGIINVELNFIFISISFVNSSTNVNDQALQSLQAFYSIEDYTNQLVTILFLEPFEGKGIKFVAFLGWRLIIFFLWLNMLG